MNTTRRKKTTRHTRKQSILHHSQIRKATQQLQLRAKQRNKVYRKNWKIQTAGGFLHTEGYTFVYDDKEGHIECLTKDRKNLCFSIDFDKESQEIGIVIGYFPNCSINKELPESTGTFVMLNTILQYVLQHPDISRYTKICLDDNSHKEIQSFEDGKVYKARLMDMYFVSTGCTWYSSLAPMFPTRVKDDETYQKGRAFILSKTWSSFLDSISIYGKIFSITPEQKKYYFEDILKEFKISEKSRARDVLNTIRTDRKYSILFYKFMDLILDAYGVLSLFGRNWTIPLRDGKILCPTGSHDVLTCENKRGWSIPASYFTYVSEEEYDAVKSSLQIPDGELLLEYPEYVKLDHNPQTTPNDLNELNEYNINANYISFISVKKNNSTN